jgi:hypothetical protein
MDPRITLLENEYANMWYYPEHKIIHHAIHQPISGEAFRNLLMTGLHYLQENSAQKWLSDDRKHSFLNAEDSAWSQEFWLPLALKSGWKHWAMLPPNNARGKINIRRLMDHVANRHGLDIKLFSDPDEALQ